MRWCNFFLFSLLTSQLEVVQRAHHPRTQALCQGQSYVGTRPILATVLPRLNGPRWACSASAPTLRHSHSEPANRALVLVNLSDFALAHLSPGKYFLLHQSLSNLKYCKSQWTAGQQVTVHGSLITERVHVLRFREQFIEQRTVWQG